MRPLPDQAAMPNLSVHGGTHLRPSDKEQIMEASTEITGSTTTNRHGRATISKRIAAITALGLAGFLGVTACTTTSPPPQSQPGSSPRVTQPAQPDPGTSLVAQDSSQQVAQDIADIAVGNGSLTALAGGGETATSATCDPTTVSNPPDVSTPTSASCDITYSDGSVWEQTVSITFDNQGNPVADSTNVGTELSQPING